MSGVMKSKTPPTAVGPTDEDIDYTKWGLECKEQPLPGMPPALEQALLLIQHRPAGAAVPELLKLNKKEDPGRRLAGPGGVPGGIPGGIPEWMKCFMPKTPPAT